MTLKQHWILCVCVSYNIYQQVVKSLDTFRNTNFWLYEFLVVLLRVDHMWQSRVEIEGYSVAYLDHIAAFEAPYR